MQDIVRDLRYAVRQLLRHPGFTAVALLSLGLGIGADSTIFSAASALLERRLDVPRPAELARVYSGQHSPLMHDVYLQVARNSRAFSALVAEDPRKVGIEGSGLNEPAGAALVSANFFTGLEVPAAAGRVFSGQPGDDPGAVVVLTHRYWRSRFQGANDVIGRAIRLNGQPFTIIGVAREGFSSSQYSWKPDFFVPMEQYPTLLGVPRVGWNSSFYVTGRIAEGRSRANAEAEVLSLIRAMPGLPPEASQPGAFRVEHARGITAEARAPVALASAFLMTIVGLVLLIACANIANLLLARATTRRKEIAIRLALGVTRARLVRQLLVESVVLALGGGAVALIIALWSTRLLAGFIPADVPVALDIAPDPWVVAFTTGLSVACGLLFGLVPALMATRADVQEALKSGTGARGHQRSRARSLFLTAQVAMAMVLLVGAALFLRSLGNARDIDPGFRAAGLVDLPIDLSLRQYSAERGTTYYQTLLDRVRAVPSVRGAALASLVPLAGSNKGTPVARGDANPDDRRSFHSTYFNQVSPGYFETLEIPLVRGRGFDGRDARGAPGSVIVNQTLAHTLWPAGEEPVGQIIRIAGDSTRWTVVGVARDSKYNSLGERDVPYLYLPLAQSYTGDVVLQTRVPDTGRGALDAIRRTAQEIDPGLPIPFARPIGEDMQISLLPAKAGAALLGSFGTLALLLASMGVYGVTAYLVAQRTSEIGIRTALGASPASVLRLMVKDSLTAVAIGIALGLAGGAGLGQLVSSQLYGVGAFDAVTFLTAPLVLALVAVAASLLPARRALRVDPLVALRVD